jgi:glucose/arabinose dehydrogenase
VLVEGWCQQFPSHSVAGLGFGPDGMLYAGGGDGASYSFVDWGQQGSPLNPCGDPPGGVGSLLSPPTAEGGALRAQDLRTSGDPTGLNGAILRLDPATGAPAAGNPLTGPDVNARRIIAYGLRNPFRFTFRPGTKELWAGDVGWDDWEEIDRIPDVTDSVVENFGWPCYEGSGRQPGYDNANLNICESLYAHSNATVAPYFSYRHRNPVVQNESCPIGGSSVAGLAFQFYTGSVYPSEYDGALFFADYSRNCIWAMQGGGNVLPSPSNIKVFLGGAAGPVELQMGPGGDLYYVSISTGTIRRISYTAAANQSPRAAVTATPTDGDAPLTVAFDGSGSRDPEGEPLAYAWDLDGDGAYDDSTAIRPSWTYVDKGEHVASLRVTDPAGASATDKVTIGVGRPRSRSRRRPRPRSTWRTTRCRSLATRRTPAEAAFRTPR